MVHNTTIPFARVGWASVSGDPETGYLYHQNGDGQLIAFDRANLAVTQSLAGFGLNVAPNAGLLPRYGILSAAVAALLTLTLTGCGDKSAETPATIEALPSVSEASATTPEPN